MKIQFCDLCNESVPQPDLDQGRAYFRKGRLICASCERSMSHHTYPAKPARPEDARDSVSVPTGYPNPLATTRTDDPARAAGAPMASPAPAVEPALAATGSSASTSSAASAAPHAAEAHSRSGGTWIAVLGLLFTTGAIFVVDDRLHAISESQKGIDKKLEKHDRDLSQVGQLRDEALAREGALEERLAGRLRGEQNARGELSTTLSELQTQLQAGARETERLSKIVADLAARPTGLDADTARVLAEISARLAQSEDARQVLVERIAALEKAGVAAVEQQPAVEPKPTAPAWQGLIADLKSADEGVRLETVYALGETKDPGILAHIVPLLKDSSVFVRMAVARFLGEYNARIATGDLIEALEDEQSAVRETAYLSLRAITGKDLKFDPNAGEAERQKRVKAWRDWYAKEKESKPSGS